MIWKKLHIKKELYDRHDWFTSYISDSQSAADNHSKALAIIGGGPKGMYALENAVSELKNDEDSYCFHWYNADDYFGCGPNFRTTLPEYLLINFCIGHVKCHRKNEPLSIVSDFPDLTEWINRHSTTDKMTEKTDFASRALVGVYLQDYLYHIIQNLPDNVKIKLLSQKVESIQYSDDRIYLPAISNQVYDSLLLCTGHCYENINPISQKAKENNKSYYYSSPYPIEKLLQIPTGKKAAVLGLGLSFVDVALALTEGKGGEFSDDSDKKYIPSGNEPMIYPFSRNNLPMIPRKGIYDQKYKLKHINQQWVDELNEKDQIDYVSEILPVLKKEISFAYYSTLLQTRDEFVINSHIEGISAEDQFSWKKLLFPNQNWKKDFETYQEFIENYLEYIIDEAEKGECESPLMAAASVWRQATPFIAQLYEFNGFTGSSQKTFLKEWYGNFSRISFGPPVENMKKISALSKAGIIRFLFDSKVEMNVTDHSFQLKSGTISENFGAFIDARIASANLSKSNSLFYKDLEEKSLVKILFNDDFRVDSIEIDPSGKIINPHNFPPGPEIYAYGTPTEGNVLDNDTLSRTTHNFGMKWAKTLKKQEHE